MNLTIQIVSDLPRSTALAVARLTDAKQREQIVDYFGVKYHVVINDNCITIRQCTSK